MTATLVPAARALESESPQKPKRDRSDLYWGAGSLVLVLALWQLASVVIGEDDSGMRLVPSISDVLSSFMVFADYWPGGLGAERTVGGGGSTVWGATLGLAYNVAISLSRFAIDSCSVPSSGSGPVCSSVGRRSPGGRYRFRRTSSG